MNYDSKGDWIIEIFAVAAFTLYVGAVGFVLWLFIQFLKANI